MGFYFSAIALLFDETVFIKFDTKLKYCWNEKDIHCTGFHYSFNFL